jgi:hypothetical protein
VARRLQQPKRWRGSDFTSLLNKPLDELRREYRIAVARRPARAML